GMADRPDSEVEEADQVYLLMKEDYHISRNVRLSWFLSKLNQVIRPSPKSELLKSENELDILSILPKGWQPDSPHTSMPYLLVPSTRVTFLARRYRFIIELDLSPSTGIVDDSTGEMIFDEVFHALSRCLAGLAAPFKIPGTDFLFQPEIFITILAYSSIVGLSSHQVLVQGSQLDCTADLDQFLHLIYKQLRAVENNIAEVLQQQHNQASEHLQRKQGVSMVTADVGLVSMVRQGILALQLLPPNSTAGIIIITDGVTSVPDVAVCETLLNQLRSGTIACSFVQVGGAYSYDCSFGYIPNVELMKFISMATFGSYMSTCPESAQAVQEMNTYHRAFLTYSFLRTSESINPDYYCFSQHKLFNEHLVSASGNPALVLRRKKHTEKEVHAELVSVVSVRLREGYTIREINFIKGGTQLEVKLVLLWKHNVRIEYVATASWPLLPAKRTTWVEVTIEGSYDILHDISCTLRKPITSPYRTSVIRRFWNTLQGINQTDQMLVHLQSFNSIQEHYTIPESTKNGVPLFYIPPGSTTPVLSLQHSGSKDSSQSQFAFYWKPILSMDANFWQRWLHMHRIAIILEHDMPVPKHVHNASSNGRFSTVQCRIAHSALTSLLRDWSSFVLVEGYSYVKLIYSTADQMPISFYLVRLISKAPCMVLRLGFPIGTMAHTRNKIVDDLREQILRLRFPHRVQSKEATPKTKRKVLGNASPSKSPPLPAPKPALSDRPCVVIFNKPLEKLLIRYEKLPMDFRMPFILSMEPFAQPPSMAAPLNVAASRTASSTLASLSRYFLHQRWVWTVQTGPAAAVSLQAVAHILSMLSEIRLSEGFHFAASGEGIVNMVIELPMAGIPPALNTDHHTCIVQYILFPPHSTSTKDSFSTDDDNDTEVEAIDVDTELNLVTECWVEPQSGMVWSPSEQHRHFRNLTYQEIPQAIFPRDLSCMSTMMTFEYLIQLCLNKDQVHPFIGSKDDPTVAPADGIHTVPFQFDLMKLLPKCQQIELFFFTFSKGRPTHMLTLLSLQNELSDREIPLADGDHVTFMHHILERERDGHMAPFSLPVIKGNALVPFCYTSLCDISYIYIDSPLMIICILCLSLYSGLYSVEENNGVQFAEPQRQDCRISFGRQLSQQSVGDAARPRCPVYIYNCSLESLKDQLVHPNSSRQPRDVFLRSLSQDRSSSSSWTDLMAHPHKQKELANYCSLLQEHYYQSYVRGVYRSLQQSYSISSQDVLTAMDYCEESLQEIDITSFLQTLCGHIRTFRERHEPLGADSLKRSPGMAATFTIGEGDDDGEDRATLATSSSIEMEDSSEVESRGNNNKNISSSSLIQDKFMDIGAQYFKTVSSNPHYFFYCPQSSKKEVGRSGERRLSEECEVSEAELATEDGNVSGCCIVSESDTDLEVEYQEQVNGKAERGGGVGGVEEGAEDESLSDSDNTMNQDEDSFSILEGDSLLEPAGPQPEMPPLFVHLVCSVSVKSSHGSMPIRTLPTCLGELISCLENAESLQSVDLNELSVTLDIFVLTLPLEIEVMPHDPHHTRYTSESSVSMNRSPGQPSSYRSDEDMTGDPLSKLPAPQKQAVLATMDEIRWLLEDEIVSALRHSSVSSSTLLKVSDHVCRSSGRPGCHHEVVPLQFVFGPEQSLEKFKEEFRRLSFPGYLLKGEKHNYHYISLSRQHSLRIQAAQQSNQNLASSQGACLISQPASHCPGAGDSPLSKGLSSGKLRPSRVQSVVSSQGSLDSDMLGYDGGSSDSECDGPTMDEQEVQNPLMPEFWLIVRIHQDRVEVFSHSREEDEEEIPEYLRLHQEVVRKIGEICRIVNQRLLLQDLHDSHVCNSLLVAESEEDIWKNESLCRHRLPNSDDYNADDSYQPRDYLAATMHFMPGHFACDVVWSTIIHIHPRLKMGPNMGVARAIQALRSVLSAFSVVNRKNMFVYQERTTKSVFYLRLSETSQTGKYSDLDGNLHVSHSVGLARSQEPLGSEDLTVLFTRSLGSRSSLEGSRPVGQVDKHILLLVHGVGQAGPEITDELVKVLRKRLDEATLDIITVMLVRNCKLTPADVEFIQPPNSAATEVMEFSLPQYSLPWIRALAHYLRQNLLIFLHIPKYTDSNMEHHFKHYFHLSSDLPDSDIYLYNKPGGQGTGGKGNEILSARRSTHTSIFLSAPLPPFFLSLSVCCSTEDYRVSVSVCVFLGGVCVRFDIWEQGNISPLQLMDKLRGALRHALCDVIMEMKVLPNPLCLETFCLSHGVKTGPSPITLIPAPSSTPATGSNTPESTTPTGKTIRRSFWEILSKPDPSEIGSPKTTDDIVQEKAEDSRLARRRHKTESVKQQWSHERAPTVELETRSAPLYRRHVTQLEEGDAGSLHPLYQSTFQPWVIFMARLGRFVSITEMSSLFLLPSIVTEVVHLVSSLAPDTTVKIFERTSCPQGDIFIPLSHVQHVSQPPATSRSFIVIGRNFQQWHYSTEQGRLSRPDSCSFKEITLLVSLSLSGLQLTLYTYNWSVDLGASLNRDLVRLVQWQNARAHVVNCLLSQKMGLFHHYCFTDTPAQEDLKQEPNPFLNSTMEAEALLRVSVPPAPNKDPTRLGSARTLPPLPFPADLMPFDEALRDVSTGRLLANQEGADIVARHGAQLLEVKAAERRELEKQMKIENLFVTWQQRSAQSNMPISVADLDTLKQSSRLVHYCATPLLFDPVFRKQIQEELIVQPQIKRHRSSDSAASMRERSLSTDSADSRLKEEPWLQELSHTFLQQYVQYLQSLGFILVQIRPQSPARSSLSTEGRASFSSFSYNKQKSEESPKSSGSGTTAYHLQRALPGGIMLMELAFQGFYFCVKQYALECSRIPMGQTVNSQLSMLFTEECDKVRDLMHVHSFSYDFHLRVVHQYLLGCHMTLRQGYQLTSFLEDFISHHPDIPKFGRNHVFQGSFSISTGMITAHQLYNYITDHAGTYGMKPLRMSKAAVTSENKKGAPSTDLHEYALVALWNSSGTYKDLEGLRHHDDFDVSLLVCHNAAPFEEQSEGERHLLRLRYYVIMTSQRELFPRLTADMRRFKNDLWEETPHLPGAQAVSSARRQIQSSVEQAMGHCRRDNLWRRLFHGEHLALDKLKLSKLAFAELEELLNAVQSRSVGEIDPQLDCFLTMSPAWYQSLIKVLLSRFPQSCRHFVDDSGIQYLAVLNQKFTDCFVLVFLDAQAGKTSLKVVFREPLPSQPQPSNSPPPQLVSMYHHLESVINTACYNLWTGLL
uniref:SZT2 subunit of KICSTOR complex n=1 Tax=Astyanax mexicanus TaxID=7994 RepID=W5L0P6_ASTMX